MTLKPLKPTRSYRILSCRLSPADVDAAISNWIRMERADLFNAVVFVPVRDSISATAVLPKWKAKN